MLEKHKAKWGWVLGLMSAALVARGQVSSVADAKRDLDSCRVHVVRSLPGSHEFASDFVEAMASDPDGRARDRNTVWGLTADLSSKVPAQDRAMYISRSTNGGKTWTQVARVGAEYFDADIGEGERNGLSVSPGGESLSSRRSGALSRCCRRQAR